MANVGKPKLLFFRLVRPDLPDYIRLHLQEQVKCLSQFFCVTVIDQASDYRQLCDTHQPDVSLFECGCYCNGQRNITNISAYPKIPRLGFCHCDAYCETRESFIADMARWGIETFFTTSVSLASYTPSLANNLFVWPNFIDPEVYHDFRLPKVIPILFTGSQAAHYPWRNRINKIISSYYPSLQCPHFGWSDERSTSKMLFGESYARMINAACVVPTCGTIANEVVRKHFEIPACNTCLFTQRTSGLEAAGFSDFVNCVFADEGDILDKVERLVRHRDELEKITLAGYELVHSCHTIRHRDQVFQWFVLNKQLKPHQRVVQLGPFMPLTIVDEKSGIRNGHVNSGGLDRLLLAQGDESLWSGHIDEAETLYRRCLNYHHDVPEPKLRLALCCLYKGNAQLAVRWVSESIQKVLETWGAVEPDPVEWAYFIVSLLCLGKVRQAAMRAKQFETLRHPELERVRIVIQMVSNHLERPTPLKYQLGYRCSVHQLPERKMDEWLAELFKMLKACRQERTLVSLAQSMAQLKSNDLVEGPNEHSRQEGMSSRRLVSSYGTGTGRNEVTVRQKVHRVEVAGNVARVKFLIYKYVLPVALWALHRVEGEIGYFLPYKWSAMRNDEAVLEIEQLFREEDIKSGLLIGAAAGKRSTEAFLAGMGQNPNNPLTVCTNFATPRFARLRRRFARNSPVQFRPISKGIGSHEGQTESFDAVVVDGSEIVDDPGYGEANGANVVVLDHISSGHTYDVCRSLLTDRNYTLVAHDPSNRGGYAIFRKTVNRQASLVFPKSKLSVDQRDGEQRLPKTAYVKESPCGDR